MSSPSKSTEGYTYEGDAEKLLREKDEEIESLKKEIETYKSTIAWQEDELNKERIAKKNQESAAATLTAVSVAGVVNDSFKTKKPSNSIEARWKNRYQQLVAYKLAHGDCNVPKSYADKALHSWVRTQREAKKDFDKGKTGCTMTQERVDALNSIGFSWFLGHQPNDSQWEEQFQAILAYKQQHGHTRISAAEDKKLYKWVLNQRARRRLLETKGEGKAKVSGYYI